MRVHIHPDGSAEAGGQSAVEALLHPGQHLLGEFDRVPLGQALAEGQPGNIDVQNALAEIKAAEFTTLRETRSHS